ncbi:hypothetical protein RO3G_13933 [Lichtheimia corymbifera JMRC:FSU:9682]|uniref:Methyltransferase-domain-containing protein n=1 Tax=Lichtheimia corymbifera JMRC:FSU:9682 TaxID=1263082 RepID=A0A068S3Z7_9FUNG|nr:hypothetical protein RO3G_13933 [Lichtheimia corymbifera JMRC:FSU:9682]
MTQQLYYIRLLKPPPNTIVPGQPFSIVWTVDNDLGEMPFLQPLNVTCHLLSNNPTARFGSTASKTINLEYDPFKGGGMVRSNLTITGTLQHPQQQQIQLVLTCSNTNSSNLKNKASHSTWHLAQQASDDTWIIPVWSQPVHLGRSSDMETSRECERQLIVGPDKKIVKIHESTGHTMADHVWDCGIWLCHYLAHYSPSKRYDHVLELGSGTAIAGIYAAHALSPTLMYLTDLPEAVSSIQDNVDRQQWDNRQKVVVEALEWGKDQQVMDNDNLDLVIISDLLYNQSSHDLLIDTLQRLMDRHPGLQTLLIYKPRYPNEERVFFDKIQKLGWRCVLDTTTVDCSPCEVYWIDIGGGKKGCSL